MKLRHFLPVVALSIPAMMSARPANPNAVISMTNPDGTVTKVYNNGDERFNYFTLEDRETIMEQNTKGFWVPVVRGGVNFKASNIAHLSALRAETKPFSFGTVREANTRMAPISQDEGRTLFPTVGEEVHSLVVLIEYADTPFTVPNTKQAFEDMLNGENYTAYGSCGSAREYYQASSNGLFNPIFDVTDIVKLEHEAAWYVGADTSFDGAGKTARFGYAIQEALLKLDAAGMDFSKYDYDGDGFIDTVFFYYSGYGQADSGKKDTIWPHQADFRRYTNLYSGTLGLEPLYLDGKQMGSYACSNELNYVLPYGQTQPYMDGIGAFVHEFAHVLGLPDLYDTTGGSTVTPGVRSVMDHASYNDYSTCPVLFSAWEKWVCHWLEFEDFTDEGGEINLPALSASNKAARIKIRAPKKGDVYYDNEYYILETRALEGFDRTMPEEGLMIWHVNFDWAIWYNNIVNSNGNRRVAVMPSKSTTPSSYVWGTTDLTSYLEPSMATALKADNPVLTAGDFKFGIYLSDIHYDADKQTTTLRYNLDKEVPDVAPQITSAVRLENGPNDIAFELAWDKVPGADGYFLTVYAESPSGSRNYLQSLNEYYVGDVNYFTVYDYFASQSKSTVKAYVRPRIKYPSSKTSDIYSFIPINLEVSAGIDDILGSDDDALIYGGYGEIVAPRDAQVYNLNGVASARENLPAGIYLVNYNGKTTKVVVR